MFNENSFVVKTWVKNVESGKYKLEQVPDISNLIEVVTSLVKL